MESIGAHTASDKLYRLEPQNCALLVVDIQERMMRVIDGKEEVTRNTVLMMKTANALSIPIVATTQYVEKIGELLPEIKAELGGVTPMDKMEFDCFGNETAAKAIKSLGNNINTLIVCGVETHICIYQTVIGGLMAGFRMWVPADAVSSRTQKNYRTGLSRIREIGGVVANTEMIIYELLRKAGTPVFRELLPFLK